VILVAVVVVLLALGGCTHKTYQSIPQCSVVMPPKADDYINATPDEQLVVMTSSYIAQVKEVATCNNNIRLINARNKSEDMTK